MNMDKFWLSLGLFAQLMFSARFVVQWVASEKAGRSIIPVSFWFISIAGSSLLLAYSIYRRDPVFILGQATGSFIYLRNLFLIWKEKKRGFS
jgi:lipid-A-disaccharide synthase-like uncharacterized protein